MNLLKALKSFADNPFKTFALLQIITAALCIGIPLFLRCCDKDVFYPLALSPDFVEMIRNDTAHVGLDSSSEEVHLRPLWTYHVILLYKGSEKPDTLLNLTGIQKDRFGFRMSISDYAYSSISYLFGMLYCIAAMLFIYNWAVLTNYQPTEKTRVLWRAVNSKNNWYNLVIGLFLLGVVLNPEHQYPYFHYIFSVAFFVANILVIVLIPLRTQGSIQNKRIRIGIALILVIALAILCFTKILTVLWAEWISLTVIGIYLIMRSYYLLTGDQIKPDRVGR